ncbi:MAG: hypothetical protein CMO76_05775 [Verrucomicrobiales bacterium]|nr:hypothetical protein [Verrucomicrobiales bacterium]
MSRGGRVLIASPPFCRVWNETFSASIKFSFDLSKKNKVTSQDKKWARIKISINTQKRRRNRDTPRFKEVAARTIKTPTSSRASSASLLKPHFFSKI